MRKLARIVKITESNKHPNADSLSIVKIGGWNVITKLDEYQKDDLAIYFEIDSWIPTELAPFLSKTEPREFNGIKGERLRTVRLRGTISQGLLLPISIIKDESLIYEDSDLTEYLKIQKWELPLDTSLRGQIKGNFPHFIPKTDAERIQNLSDKLVDCQENNLEFEVSEKLDGSSFTGYIFQNEFNVCSRNLNLKHDINNAFWKAAIDNNIEEKLRKLNKNIAIQGEIIGPKIQGNPYKINDIQLFIFNVFDIDEQKYLSSVERMELLNKLNIKSVPILKDRFQLNDMTIESFLSMAEDKSLLNHNTEREGLVFKCISDTNINFKAISNKFLMKYQ